MPRHATKHRSQLEWLPFVALIPLLLLFYLWYQKNEFYPYGDAADYLSQGADIVRSFQLNGFFEGLWTAYFARSAKGIMVRLSNVPFLAATGDVRLATALSGAFFYSVIFLALYRLLRAALTPIRATIATVFACTLPWLISAAYFISSQMPFLASLALAALAFERSERLTKRGSSAIFGFFLALAYCFRPVEALIFTIAPLAAFSYLSLKRKQIESWDIGIVISLIAAAAVAFAFMVKIAGHGPDFTTGTILTMILLAATALATGYRARARRASRPFLLAFGTCYGIIVSWWIPFSLALFNWIVRCSWGEETLHTENRIGISSLGFLWRIGSQVAGPALPLLIVAVATNTTAKARKDSLRWLKDNRVLAAALGFSVLAHSLLGSVSANGALNYYYQEIILVYLLLAVACLRPERLRAPGVTLSILIAISLFHLAYSYAVVFAPQHADYLHSQSLVPDEYFPPLKGKDSTVEIVERILPFIEKDCQSYLPHNSRNHISTQQLFDGMAGGYTGVERLKLIQWEMGLKCSFEGGYIDDARKQIGELRQATGYLLIGPLEGYALNYCPSSVGAKQFADAWRTGRLGSFGLEVLTTFSIKSKLDGDKPVSYLFARFK